MSAERSQSIQTDEKTLEPEQTSGSDTPKLQLSRRPSQEDKPQQDVTEQETEPVLQAPPGIIPPQGDLEKQASRITEGLNRDPNIVDWDENDQGNPLNWSVRRKWRNMSVVSGITFLTPLASSMVAPGVQLIMRDFNSTNQTVGSFIVSIYVLGYAVGPLFIAPMSEVYGRLPMYHSCNIMFVIWTMACALAPNMGSLLAFRLFAGIAGSCPITIGGGTIADTFDQKSRGAAMALFAMGPLMGPVIGPVAGGYLTQAVGWRWIFWVILIAVCIEHLPLKAMSDQSRAVSLPSLRSFCCGRLTALSFSNERLRDSAKRPATVSFVRNLIRVSPKRTTSRARSYGPPKCSSCHRLLVSSPPIWLLCTVTCTSFSRHYRSSSKDSTASTRAL